MLSGWPHPLHQVTRDEAVEVDHVFAVGAEIVGHVHMVGLIGQSSNRVWTP